MSSEGTRVTLRHCMRKLLRERPLSKISVSDICNLAHIGRRTFYRYYSDKYELMKDVTFNYMTAKMDLREDDDQWDVIRKCAELIYRERDYFSHAFGSKGQNGFWEESMEFMKPYVLREHPDSGYLYDRCRYLMMSDVNTMMEFMEQWVRAGFPTDPETFCRETRHAFAIYSKWLYQSAMGREEEPATEQQLEDGSW